MQLPEERDHVAGVEHLIALAARAGHRHQMVVADEQAQIGVPVESFGDPAIVLAPDLALVDVRLGGVDGNERELHPADLGVQPRVTRAELLLEADIADVASVVVARDEHDLRTLDRVELGARLRVLVGIAVVGQVARDDDQVGGGSVDLLDRAMQQLGAEACASDVNVR